MLCRALEFASFFADAALLLEKICTRKPTTFDLLEGFAAGSVSVAVEPSLPVAGISRFKSFSGITIELLPSDVISSTMGTGVAFCSSAIIVRGAVIMQIANKCLILVRFILNKISLRLQK